MSPQSNSYFTIRPYKSPLNFLRFLFLSRDTIVFICRETLLANSARPRKIPQCTVLVCENISVNKQAYRKLTTEIVLREFFVVLFFKCYTWLSGLSSKKAENNYSVGFWYWSAEENLLLNNKDNTVFKLS